MPLASRKIADLQVAPTAFNAVDVASVLAEMVGHPLFDISRALMTASDAATDDAGAKALALLGQAFSAALRASDPSEPFRPYYEFPDSRGVVPSDFSTEQIEALAAARGRHPADPAYDARLSDILWVRAHGGRRDPAHARDAIQAYLASAALRVGEAATCDDAVASAERAIRLAYLVDRADRGGFVSRCRKILLDLSSAIRDHDNLRYAYLRFDTILFEFGIGDPDEQAEICEGLAREDDSSESRGSGDEFWEVASRWWARSKNDERRWLAVERRADWRERQADLFAESAPANAVGFVHEALKLARQLPSERRTERVRRLRATLASLEPRTLQQMGRISSEFDPTELIRRSEAEVSGKPFLEALTALAGMCGPGNVARLREQTVKQGERFLVSSLFTSVVLDNRGKTISVVPPMRSDDPVERERAIRFGMVRDANLSQDLSGRAIVEPARLVILAEHQVTEASLLPLLFRSPFVPGGRERVWARGLHAALTGDFEVAVHLLLPQLEAALRELVRSSHSIPATSLDAHGQQQDWTLTMLLSDANKGLLEEVIGEDLVFDLTALLVDRYGYNLRNIVAHGLIGGNLNIGPARHLLALCIRLIIDLKIAPLGEEDATKGEDDPSGEV